MNLTGPQSSRGQVAALNSQRQCDCNYCSEQHRQSSVYHGLTHIRQRRQSNFYSGMIHICLTYISRKILK